MESSEKIINNYDVLQLIFRYLDFEEHLKLIKICPQFEYAIFHGVWRLNCKYFCITKLYSDKLYLQYSPKNNFEISRREIRLKPEVIHRILHHFSMYIHKLELSDIKRSKNIISFKYHNLTELSMRDTDIPDLQSVAKNCLNLQSFTLIDCTTYSEQSKIRGYIFGKMKALTKLEISGNGLHGWNYFDIQQLFCLPQLKTLIINISIRDSNDNNESNNNSPDRVYNIENLTIGRLPYLQSGNIYFIEDLMRCQNLTKLTITSSYKTLKFHDNNLTQINNACPKLCELSFHKCYFAFKEFPRMNNLTHLTFKECKNVGSENFDEIFRKLKLKSLSIMSVRRRLRVNGEDILNYNYISNTLETLTISDGFYLNIVKTFFNRQHKFENVSKVELEIGCNTRVGSTELCFSHNFPYLQELIMDFFYISSEDILHLEHLKVLEFEIFDNMSSSYLEILFKHPTLKHITIKPYNWEDSDYVNFPRFSEGLTTTLEFLSLPSSVFQRDTNFWSSFQQRNKLLKLEIVKCVKNRYDESFGF